MKPLMPRAAVERIVDDLAFHVNDPELALTLLQPGPPRELVAHLVSRATVINVHADVGITVTWGATLG